MVDKKVSALLVGLVVALIFFSIFKEWFPSTPKQQNVSAMLNMINDFIANNQIKEANESLEIIRKNGKCNNYCKLLYGKIKLIQGYYAEALWECNEIVYQEKCYQDALLCSAKALHSLHQYMPAQDLYQQAIACHPEVDTQYYHYFQLLYDTNNYTQIIQQYQQLHENHHPILHTIQSKLLLASTHLQLGQFDKSIQYYENIPFQNFDDISIRHYHSALTSLGDLKRALAITRKYTMLKPKNTEGHILCALSLLLLNRPSEAMIMARIAVVTNTSNSHAWTVLGKSYITLKQVEYGIEALTIASKLSPQDDPSQALEKGKALLMLYDQQYTLLKRSGDSSSSSISGSSSSSSSISGSNQYYPLSQGIRVSLGIGLYEAYILLLQAVDYCSGCEEAWIVLGQVQQKLGLSQDALRSYLEASSTSSNSVHNLSPSSSSSSSSSNLDLMMMIKSGGGEDSSSLVLGSTGHLDFMSNLFSMTASPSPSSTFSVGSRDSYSSSSSVESVNNIGIPSNDRISPQFPPSASSVTVISTPVDTDNRLPEATIIPRDTASPSFVPIDTNTTSAIPVISTSLTPNIKVDATMDPSIALTTPIIDPVIQTSKADNKVRDTATFSTKEEVANEAITFDALADSNTIADNFNQSPLITDKTTTTTTTISGTISMELDSPSNRTSLEETATISSVTTSSDPFEPVASTIIVESSVLEEEKMKADFDKVSNSESIAINLSLDDANTNNLNSFINNNNSESYSDSDSNTVTSPTLTNQTISEKKEEDEMVVTIPVLSTATDNQFNQTITSESSSTSELIVPIVTVVAVEESNVSDNNIITTIAIPIPTLPTSPEELQIPSSNMELIEPTTTTTQSTANSNGTEVNIEVDIVDIVSESHNLGLHQSIEGAVNITLDPSPNPMTVTSNHTTETTVTHRETSLIIEEEIQGGIGQLSENNDSTLVDLSVSSTQNITTNATTIITKDFTEEVVTITTTTSSAISSTEPIPNVNISTAQQVLETNTTESTSSTDVNTTSILKDPKVTLADQYIKLAVAYSGRGQYDMAIKQLAKAIKKAPEYPPSFLLRSQCYLGLGDIGKGTEDLLTVLRLDPCNDTAVYYATSIGLQLSQMKQHQEVIKLLDPIHQCNRSDQTISIALASSLAALGSNVQALEVLTNSSYSPQSRQGMLLLTGLYERANQSEIAEVILRKGLAENLTTWMDLGDMLSRQNRSQEAVECLVKTLLLRPKDGPLYRKLGFIYAEQLNDSTTAMAYFEKAMDLGVIDTKMRKYFSSLPPAALIATNSDNYNNNSDSDNNSSTNDNSSSSIIQNNSTVSVDNISTKKPPAAGFGGGHRWVVRTKTESIEDIPDAGGERGGSTGGVGKGMKSSGSLRGGSDDADSSSSMMGGGGMYMDGYSNIGDVSNSYSASAGSTGSDDILNLMGSQGGGNSFEAMNRLLEESEDSEGSGEGYSGPSVLSSATQRRRSQNL